MTVHRGRLELLRRAAFNTARLSGVAVSCDLSTDVRSPAQTVETDMPIERLEGALAEVFAGYREHIVTTRGRVAEAVVCAALIRPGRTVLANEVYVTGAWSIAREGGILRGIGGALSVVPGRGPVEGLRLDRAEEELRSGQVGCLWLTTPRVLLSPGGGAVVDLAAVVELAALRDRWAPALPLVIDATKIGEWAARACDRTGTRTGTTPTAALRTLAGIADVIVLSARKDAGGISRGLIVARDAPTIARIRSFGGRALAGGEEPSAAELGALARGLRAMGSVAEGEWGALERIAGELVDGGAPIVSWGGGALFVDADAALPEVSREQCPAQTLLALLYLKAGLRGLGTPLSEPGPSLVRLSLRGHGGWLRDNLGPALADLCGLRSGLVADGLDPPGPYLEGMVPVDPDAWERLACDLSAPPTAAPSVLGGGVGDDFAAAVRERLALPRLQVEPLGRPRGRLAEVWARLHRAGSKVHGDEGLSDLSKRWRSPGRGELGDLWVGAARELEGVLERRASADLVAVVLDVPAAWEAARGHPRAHEVDLWIVPAGTLAADAGALCVRAGTPLSGALSESVLFAVGSPGSGGLDGDELSRMAAALRAGTWGRSEG